ncbi:Protein of unknown function [Pyronema omphalodes CBS 100304]|uniref:Uncharacterized protein n=1 Tax=Pyronema omphalodes (strain CBS 100304) TaxID=1076935 RepID=U4L5A7_PYROM|nr:Protein of unknown function [Pyronema omphalodes CBS 100304]
MSWSCLSITVPYQRSNSLNPFIGILSRSDGFNSNFEYNTKSDHKNYAHFKPGTKVVINPCQPQKKKTSKLRPLTNRVNALIHQSARWNYSSKYRSRSFPSAISYAQDNQKLEFHYIWVLLRISISSHRDFLPSEYQCRISCSGSYH